VRRPRDIVRAAVQLLGTFAVKASGKQRTTSSRRTGLAVMVVKCLSPASHSPIRGGACCIETGPAAVARRDLASAAKQGRRSSHCINLNQNQRPSQNHAMLPISTRGSVMGRCVMVAFTSGHRDPVDLG
jgi:hypothetical protein